MNMPGFTAEVTLYKMSEHYHMIGTANASEGSREVLPQLRILRVDPDCFNGCIHALGPDAWTFCENYCRVQDPAWGF